MYFEEKVIQGEKYDSIKNYTTKIVNKVGLCKNVDECKYNYKQLFFKYAICLASVMHHKDKSKYALAGGF